MQNIRRIWQASVGGKIMLGCAGLFGLVLICVACSAVVTAISPRRTATQSAATARPTTASQAEQIAAVASTPVAVPATPMPTETPMPVPTSEPTAIPEPTAVPTPEPTATAAGLPGVGERVETTGVAMTVNSVERKDALSSFQEAEAGNEYLIVDVLVENTADVEEPYNPFYFKVKDGNGVESSIEMNTGQGSFKSGKLPPGDKVKGTVAFKVTKGASGLVITYEPLVIFGGYKPIRIRLD